MVNALILDGSAASDKAASIAKKSLEEQLKATGWQVDSVTLRDKQIAGCTSCFGCWLQTPGTCLVPDDGRETARLFIQSNLTIFLTPATFGGYSYELKKAIDRLLPNIMPYIGKFHGELHHTKRYKQYPNLISIGTLPERDDEAEEIFRTLLEREAWSFHSPAIATGFAVQGQSADTISAEVRRLLLKTGVSA